MKEQRAELDWLVVDTVGRFWLTMIKDRESISPQLQALRQKLIIVKCALGGLSMWGQRLDELTTKVNQT